MNLPTMNWIDWIINTIGTPPFLRSPSRPIQSLPCLVLLDVTFKGVIGAFNLAASGCKTRHGNLKPEALVQPINSISPNSANRSPDHMSKQDHAFRPGAWYSLTPCGSLAQILSWCHPSGDQNVECQASKPTALKMGL